MVTDQEIAKSLEILLRQSDLNTVTSLSAIVQQLEAKLGLDLSHKAAFIRDQIQLLFRAHPVSHPDPHPIHSSKTHFSLYHNHQPQLPPPPHFISQPQFSSHFSLHQHLSHPHDLNFRQPSPQLHVPPRQTHTTLPAQLGQQGVAAPKGKPAAKVSHDQTPKESPAVGTKRRGGPGGLNKVCGVTPELQVIVGEPALPRTEIVKQLWAYIRKNNLQDPSNKRKIICDDALRIVFETDCTDMFKMNKLLSKHIITLEPSKAGQAKRAKVEAESTTDTKKPVSSSVIISEGLAKFLGTEVREMLDTEVMRLVSEYVKLQQLQDPSNPIVILCDQKLQELLGCDSVSAVGIYEMVRHHLFMPS